MQPVVATVSRALCPVRTAAFRRFDNLTLELVRHLDWRCDGVVGQRRILRDAVIGTKFGTYRKLDAVENGTFELSLYHFGVDRKPNVLCGDERAYVDVTRPGSTTTSAKCAP